MTTQGVLARPELLAEARGEQSNIIRFVSRNKGALFSAPFSVGSALLSGGLALVASGSALLSGELALLFAVLANVYGEFTLLSGA